MKKVAKTILATIWRLGKGTATVLGLAMLLALVAGLASTAFAFVPGDPLELGRLNPINRITRVVGNTNDALLRISNGSTGDSATVLKLRVRAGKAPMTVSAHAGKAINLNADKVDGMGASAFFSGNTYKVQDGRIGPGEGRMAFRLVREPSSKTRRFRTTARSARWRRRSWIGPAGVAEEYSYVLERLRDGHPISDAPIRSGLT